MVKFILGFTLCAFVALVLYICDDKLIQTKALLKAETQTLKLLRDTSVKITPVTLNELNVRILSTDEKIEFVNKRFDDLYLLGGTIIILILGINVGIFVRTEFLVDKYFRDNFSAHHDRIVAMEQNAADLFGQMTTSADSLRKIAESDDQQIAPPEG